MLDGKIVEKYSLTEVSVIPFGAKKNKNLSVNIISCSNLFCEHGIRS
jgi:hypothetical protein